mmetsp:Transcript_1230/g.2539  ORF Transcript_1230/g.2539 Transcript_1230/m.2539 type:complete len:1366 (-) Transcript_1230:148-4245(-)|eukprot:CAMPEP_0197626484 /NCGR_PEP_ID=MMETSP1338-20131121/5429_1 /TAXON_ID=43686 ORGANISM="Pelagodinium beii, Strain RCC1491" /NCGR_SAMPLE_ID=MMETSP1338 /ASSEMBLY_ACC=CAM_ASM_000754 /LENGTH=1365 /DNA_ID=CAMNT_0043197025 /DNA_START=66 /DNA_END=4163 /DNA_ORIENTATION=+
MSVKSAIKPSATKRTSKTPNCLSRLLFWWVNAIIAIADKRPVEEDDLFDIPDGKTTTALLQEFDAIWHPETAKQEELADNKYMMAVIKKMFGPRLIRSGVLMLLQNSCQLAVPLLMQEFLSWHEDLSAPKWIGWAFIAGTALAMFLGSVICSSHAILQLFMIGMDIRSLCNALVYRKSLRLSHTARSKTGTGQIVTLMSSDCERIPMSLLGIHQLWLAPVFIIISMSLLIWTVGLAAVAGIVILVITLPLPIKLAKKQQHAVMDQVKQTDKRIKAVNDGLQGIKVLKYNAWDVAYGNLIKGLRILELSYVRRMARLQAISMASMGATPIFIGLGMIITLFLLDPAKFRPASIFTALSLLNLLRMPLGFLPMGIKGLAELKVSMSRFQQFLLLEEIEESPDGNRHASMLPTLVPMARGPGLINLSSASFEWNSAQPDSAAQSDGKGTGKGEKGKRKTGPDPQETQKEQSFQLQDVSVTLSGPQLCAVVGRVGTGKTSLLAAMLGEMPRTNGKLQVEGSVAYCSQSPWIFNATLRDNILFNHPFDEVRYNEVIEMCALETDCYALPGGDFTEIGEKGVTLSGGQKARVALARACYSSAAVYVLDDILSAVDSETGAWIFERCIQKLVEQGATVVLATNQVHFLPSMDHIIVLGDSGSIVKQGSFQELQRLDLDEIKLDFSVDTKEASKTSKAPKNVTDTKKSSSRLSLHSKKEKLTEKETKAEGTVSWRVWYFFFVTCSGGWTIPLTGIGVLLFTQLTKNASDWFLGYWADAVTDSGETAPDGNLGIYAMLGVLTCATTLFRNIAMSEVIIRNGKSLHEQLLASVLRARMSFFDTTPTGRILNRFSKDMDSVDTQLQRCLPVFLWLFSEMIGVCLTIVFSMPFFFIPLLPMCVFYYDVQRRFRPLSRDVQRMESVSRSPIFAQFSETLHGISTIRAYDQSAHFLATCMERIDSSNRAFFTLKYAERWLQVRLEGLGVGLFFAVCCFAVQGRGDTVTAGAAGLTLYYAQGCTSMMNFALRMATETEAKMTSTERIHEYITEVEPEAANETSLRPPPGWPSKGRIEFQKVSMRYREGLPLVLSGLTFVVEGGSKVGVCGRTGCGKSTLLNVLFRINDISGGSGCGEGTILLDNIDIMQLGLKDLRTALAIIPQDAVMFAGTVRDNLDLFQEKADQELWSALNFAALEETVRSLPGGLEAHVEEGGQNFSCGQRQLLCLARALLRRSQVLCLDEATANIDFETDKTIQKVIKSEFAHCTTLTIAHRLNTIVHSDRVLFLDQGRVAEYDTPARLLAPGNQSKFRLLVNEMGEGAEVLENEVFSHEFTAVSPSGNKTPGCSPMVELSRSMSNFSQSLACHPWFSASTIGKAT